MNFDAANIFLNDLDWSFALEIALRTSIMFFMILAFLRLSGKKGVRQLSLFEVAIVIGLGSAAGDPMLNREFAILPAILVFVCILAIYKAITWAATRSEKIEKMLEGHPVYIIEDGEFVLAGNDHHPYAKDEFFAEMRQQSVEHVGQIKAAVLETNGVVSFHYYEDDEVKPGLPVWPNLYKAKTKWIKDVGEFACTTCAHVEHIGEGTNKCSRCNESEWVTAINTKRQA